MLPLLQVLFTRRNPLKTGLGTPTHYSGYLSTRRKGRNPLKTGLGTPTTLFVAGFLLGGLLMVAIP